MVIKEREFYGGGPSFYFLSVSNSRNAVKFLLQMSASCPKVPKGKECTKDKSPPRKSTEAKLWLNMMNSMLNFAMASTTLMKSIQNRVEVTRKLEEDARAMNAAAFFKQEVAKSMTKQGHASEDFSLRSAPVREDTCGQPTCTMLFTRKEPEDCGPTCDGKKSLKKKSTCPKKKNNQESVGTIGGSCLCITPLPEEPKENENKDKDTCSCTETESCQNEYDDDTSCVCADDDIKEEKEIDSSEPQEVHPAAVSIEEIAKYDDCSCPSIECKEDIEEAELPDVELTTVEVAKNGIPEEPSITDCGCQATSSQDLMIKEIQMANLAYQMRQTDKNLKELKKEMDRISTFVDGKKKCNYATAAALYEEIMKPRTLPDGRSRSDSRRRRV